MGVTSDSVDYAVGFTALAVRLLALRGMLEMWLACQKKHIWPHAAAAAI